MKVPPAAARKRKQRLTYLRRFTTLSSICGCDLVAGLWLLHPKSMVLHKKNRAKLMRYIWYDQNALISFMCTHSRIQFRVINQRKNIVYYLLIYYTYTKYVISHYFWWLNFVWVCVVCVTNEDWSNTRKKIVKLLIMAKKNLCVVIRNKETSNS